MTIEIHRPEIEALIQQRLQSGAFLDVEEVLLHALTTSEPPSPVPGGMRNKSLVEVCAMVRGLLTDAEVDTLFRRDPSPDRPVDLS
jgi:hypothetical protein